jgi:hypothetical protein
MSKQRGILYSAPMVLAKLARTKTQTRRIVKPQPDPTVDYRYDVRFLICDDDEPHILSIGPCPYGQPGDVLYGRETLLTDAYNDVYYAADGAMVEGECDRDLPVLRETGWERTISSLFMPWEFARIWDEIVEVRVERLQNITEADAIAEGIEVIPCVTMENGQRKEVDRYHDYGRYPSDHPKARLLHSPEESYRRLWERINGAGSWAANPWVWVVVTKPIDKPSDENRN